MKNGMRLSGLGNWTDHSATYLGVESLGKRKDWVGGLWWGGKSSDLVILNLRYLAGRLNLRYSAGRCC